jgi:hypothetical protein
MKDKIKKRLNNYSEPFYFYIFPDSDIFSRNSYYLDNLNKNYFFYKITGKNSRFSKIKEKIGLSEQQETKRFLDYITNNFNSSEIKNELVNLSKQKNLELTIYKVKN